MRKMILAVAVVGMMACGTTEEAVTPEAAPVAAPAADTTVTATDTSAAKVVK